jgi:nucleotide-binding universal stress UspA family protein
MKNIAVLIDFTEGSKVALSQGAALARKTNSKLYGVHIVSSQGKVDAAQKQLAAFMNEHAGAGIPMEMVVGEGSLASATNEVLKKIAPDLVIICTHGVRGMFQHLFGAQILKLVQALPYSCMVIQENNKTDLAGAQKILFPVGPHPEFQVKIKQAAVLSKALHASLVIYEIDRAGGDYENQLAKNLEQAKAYFDEHGVSYTRVLEDVKVISVGYSRQTIDYASTNGIPIICLMAGVSKNEELFGVGDKENFLVNEQGVSIMTCNA